MNPDVLELMQYNAAALAPRQEDWVERIISSVAVSHGVRPQWMKGEKRRSRQISAARGEACRRLVEAGFSYPETARLLGMRNHTSVLYWVKKQREVNHG